MNTQQNDAQETLGMQGEDCWQAVLARDVRFDKRFVYAVRSTGIYCRPSCPSRRPRREQVVFYPLPEAAQRAGFRPCRRCQPEVARRNRQAELVERICRAIEASLEGSEGPLTLAALSAQAGVGPHHLQRSFKRVMGITPRQYADARRLGRLKTRLRAGQDVTGALYEAGYGSSRALYERAPAQLGMTPATYRKGGRGMRIGYTVVDCPLGRLLVGATERGVCAVCLGNSDSALEAALRKEYPSAEIYADKNGLGHAGLSRWVSAFLNHLSGKVPHLDLPIDVQATAFQWRVWEELRAIPYGNTRSYSEIAKALGHPKAVRAVARACATNPVAVLVPCHRVVQQDGSLGGYRWGLERKRALLAQEQGLGVRGWELGKEERTGTRGSGFGVREGTKNRGWR